MKIKVIKTGIKQILNHEALIIIQVWKHQSRNVQVQADLNFLFVCFSLFNKSPWQGYLPLILINSDKYEARQTIKFQEHTNSIKTD